MVDQILPRNALRGPAIERLPRLPRAEIAPFAGVPDSSQARISELPPVTAATLEMLLEVAQFGQSRRLTAEQLIDLVPPPDLTPFLRSIVGGAGIIVLGGAPTPTVALATVPTVAAGQFGDTHHVPVVTVDEFGRIIDISVVPVALPDLSAYAPINSPAFTGQPTAPTPPPSTNDQRIVNAAFVAAAIAAIPAQAPLDSPSFTGNPTAPTAPIEDNTLRLANTLWVRREFLTLVAAAATYAPLASPQLTGNPTAPTPAPQAFTSEIATAAWVRQAIVANAASIIASPTPPTNPRVNQLWWNSSDVAPGGAKLFLYFDDGDSQQWVPASTGARGSMGDTGRPGDPGERGEQGPPGPASLLQVIDTMSAEWGYYGAQAAMPSNDAPRTTAMGVEVGRVVITPKSADSVLDISALYNIYTNASDSFGIIIFRDGEMVGGGWLWHGTSAQMQMRTQARVPSGSTAPTTFTVNIGANGGTGFGLNGTGSTRLFGGSLLSGMIIREEIAP